MSRSMPSSPIIAIIGAGPSGLIAAEMLAKAGCCVTIYDQMPTPARKFLIAGRGGLNLTHSEPLETFVTRYGESSAWLTPLINSFSPSDLRQWCEELGVETFIGTSGRVFPKSMKAVQLLRLWLKRLEQLGVQYAPRHTFQGFAKHNDEPHTLHLTHGDHHPVVIKPDATLLALGGASWPRLGSDGRWCDMLTRIGVAVSLLRPSNCGFIVPWSNSLSERFAGQPLKSIAITHAQKTHQGDIIITSTGLEGGAIYALSAHIRDAILANGRALIHLDLRPTMSVEALANKFHAPRGSKSLSTYLRGAGFSPLNVALLRELIPHEQLINIEAYPVQLAKWLKALPITLTATAGMSRAISSSGGVMRCSVNDDLMLKNCQGVFIAGEMLDWEAPTGGYLLQGCFSTGVAAANGMIRYCKTHLTKQGQ